MSKKFPTYVNIENVLCFNCKDRVTGPWSATGYAKGKMKGQCPSCKMITYFDLKQEETPSVEK